MYSKKQKRTDADIFMMLVVSEGTSGNIALHMCEARSSQQRYRDQGLELCEVAIRIANASLLAMRSQTEACSCRASSQPPRQRPTSHARCPSQTATPRGSQRESFAPCCQVSLLAFRPSFPTGLLLWRRHSGTG